VGDGEGQTIVASGDSQGEDPALAGAQDCDRVAEAVGGVADGVASVGDEGADGPQRLGSGALAVAGGMDADDSEPGQVEAIEKPLVEQRVDHGSGEEHDRAGTGPAPPDRQRDAMAGGGDEGLLVGVGAVQVTEREVEGGILDRGRRVASSPLEGSFADDAGEVESTQPS
jgi:hypothetical protein